MLNITPQVSSKAAKSYFVASDYFLSGMELPGVWYGRGAEMLGLEQGSTVGRQEFERMCDNLHPVTGKQLTKRTLDNRRVGYDFTFNAPKSVSLVYELTNDKAILDDFRNAVRQTMTDIEADVQTRIRLGKASGDRTSGNLAWAEFVHFTSRPVDGVPDPSLHAHCFAFNATHDPVEDSWKAVQFGDVKRDGAYYEALFHSHLSKSLADRGYHIRRAGKFWEIDGLPKATLDKFSRRTAIIDKAAAMLGITDAKQKAQLGAKTRESKNKLLGYDKVQQDWWGRLTGDEVAALQRCKQSPQAPEATAEQAADHAMQKEFERKSVVPERQLAESAMRRSFGSLTPRQVKQGLAKVPLIRRVVDGRAMATSKEVLEEERGILEFVTQGRGTCKAIAPGDVTMDSKLGTDQVAAVSYLLASRDRVMLVRGAAGTGKTTMTREAVRLMREHGQDVLMLAPSAQASRGVLRDEGFKDADTIARLLVDPKMQAAAKGKVLWVDEAGLLGAPQLAKLFAIAEANGNRVILMGDTKQHSSPDRGTAMRLLERHAGLPVVEVTQVRRQERNEYRQAVELFSQGESIKGLEALEKLGWVKHGGAEMVADLYVESLDENKETLIVSPTHAAGRQATAAIRNRLKRLGRLGESKTITSLVDTQWTAAERGDAANYVDGDLVIRFFRNTAGFKTGQMVRKADVSDAVLKKAVNSFRVFRPETIDVAPGDTVRFTANGTTVEGDHKLMNGATYHVKSLAKDGSLVLDNGWRVGRDFPFLQHGYSTTSHASQGRTIKRVILFQPAASIGAASREQAYVSLSRGKEQAMIITDDVESLRKGFEKTDTRINAIELPGLRPRPKARRHAEALARLGSMAAELWNGITQSATRGMRYEPNLAR